LRAAAEEADLSGVAFALPTGESAWLRTYGHRVPHEGMYKWVIEVEGITISIAPRPHYGKCPNVLIRLGSIPCMAYGGQGAWRLALDIVESLGFKPSYCKASELHVCADLLIAVAEFVEAYSRGCYITRAVKGREYQSHRRKTGFDVGRRSATQLEVYDKLQELREKPGLEADRKRELLRTYRGVGDNDHCTRLEFRMQREELRGYEIDTVDDLFDRLPYIVGDLTTCWFRMVDQQPDRENRNQSRLPESALWSAVREGFKWVGEEKCLPREKVFTEVSSDTLVRQAEGVIIAAMARRHGSAAEVAAFMHEFANALQHFGEEYFEEIKQVHGPLNRQQKLTARRVRNRARVGAYNVRHPLPSVPIPTG
jgi:hypothetical protein